jgi:hypothetical protein
MENDTIDSREPVNSEAPTSRRSFLKSTGVALPAVITLHSGAALAATSVVQCLSPPVASPPPYCQTPDSYMRVLCSGVYNRREKNSTGKWVTYKTAYYFEGHDMDGPCVRRKDGTKVIPGSTEYTQNINDTKYLGSGQTKVALPTLSSTEKTWYALTQYNMTDAKMNKVTLCGAPLDRSGQMTAFASCMTSLVNLP